MKNIFIIGSKGIPANYGGFETFVDKLTEKRINKSIKYHVSCLADNDKEFEYNGARCFNINIPNIVAAKAVYYDLVALNKCIEYIEKNNIRDSIIYILACRIGPFLWLYKKRIKSLGGTLLVNPDGHEWKRSKWNSVIRYYWKVSEKLMVKYADLLVCDSKNIERYIKEDYKKYKPNTTFIAYGADIDELNSKQYNGNELLNWYKEKGIKSNDYYLIVGRFVPENNYETMIAEFMKSTTSKKLVIITNIEKNKFYERLKQKTEFYKDERIKFVGTVYNKDLLKEIRKNAYGYLHGHEVGGTNPSLLEALATTNLNLLLDVGFNREVAMDGALYFNKEHMDLSNLIDKLDKIDSKEIKNISDKAKRRIYNEYLWEDIISSYERLFLLL
ncbi:glycosyltransferase family 1 protein [Clostridium perfringens]|nr:glycosyltransferase family 1 protein [Clostridium perfringens]EHA1021452.1 glycosyltransferase family 1 protein [Clostridium perfringens]